VAALPRIVTIDNVELHPAADSKGSTNLRMTALAKTYRYLEDSEKASAPAPAAKAAGAKK